MYFTFNWGFLICIIYSGGDLINRFLVIKPDFTIMRENLSNKKKQIYLIVEDKSESTKLEFY